MTTRLLADRPWTRITELATGARAWVAVPFIGKGAASMLPLATGSVLVTRLDEGTVRQGQVDPREVLKLMRRGVEVHACADLHAKVYVFGRRAVVGSANLSRTSAALTEACIETTDPSAVADARAFVRGLCSVPVGPQQVKRLVPMFPKYDLGRARRQGKAVGTPKLYVIPADNIEWEEEVQQADRRGTASAKARLLDAQTHGLDKIDLGFQDVVKLSLGDIVTFRLAAGRGFIIEPPGHVIHIEPHSSGAIVYTEVPKRRRSQPSAAVREALGDAAEQVLYRSDSIRLVRRAATAKALLSLWPPGRRADPTDP